MNSFGTNAVASSEIFGYRVTQSIVGKPVPVVIGTNRIPAVCIAVWNWVATPVSSGGKFGGKGAGGKGGNQQQYSYQMAAIQALCLGPIAGIARIWQDKSLLVVSFQQAAFAVPGGGGTYNPTTASLQTFVKNGGVWKIVPRSVTYNDYGSPGSVTITVYDVVAGVEVSGTPGAGQYSVDPVTGAYTFAAADAGIIWQIGYKFVQGNPTAAGQIPIGTLAITLFTGERGQAQWAGSVGQATPQIGYSEIAYVANEAWQLGTSGTLPNCSYEVEGILQYGSGIGAIDALPSDCINFLLTDFNALDLSTGLIHSSLTTLVAHYCLGNSIFISPVLDSQTTYADQLREWLMIANSEIISSEGLLKFGCYSEQTAAGYGVTYTPNTQPQYDLGLDDFIVSSPNEPPIKWSVLAASDVANKQTIEWTDRNNEYNGTTLQEEDSNSVALYGANPTTAVSARSICIQSVAAQVLNVQIKRAVNNLRMASFTLGWKYSLLEPMDVVTVPEQYPSITRLAVRLLTIDEDDTGNLACTAEVLLYGISAPTLHPKQSSSPFTPGFQANPGSVNPPIFFEAPEQLTQQVGFELLIALSGGSPNWGGASVYMASDGPTGTYVFLGKVTAKSDMGVTSTTLPFAHDPDTTNALGVDLRESLGTLEPFSRVDCDNFKSLVLVDQELLAYEYATVTGSNQYSLASGGSKYLRRGVFGTDVVAHDTDAPFTAIDGNQFELAYQSSDVGTTKWFKFTSFNLAGQMEEDIANVQAYQYFLKGPRLPYPWNVPDAAPNANNAILPWGRFQIQALSTLNPDGTRSSGITNSDGSRKAGVLITGTGAPVNTFSKITQPPTISLSTTTTGGSLAGGQTIIIGVFAIDLNGDYTDLSYAAINIPAGTSTNKIVATVTFWDPVNDSGVVFATIDPDLGWALNGTIAIGGTTSNITTLPPLVANEPVDNSAELLVANAHVEPHAGIWGGGVSVATPIGGGQATLQIIGSTWGVNDMAGHIVTLLATGDLRIQQAVEVLIASNTADTLTIPDVVTSGNIVAGDIIAIRTLADTFSSTTIGDSKFINGGAGQPGTGLVVDQDKGNLVLIIAGAGAFQAPRPILSNTSTVFTISGAFFPVPNATSIFIVIQPNQVTFAPYNPGPVATPALVVSWPFPLDNSIEHTFFLTVVVQNANGETSISPTPAAFREFYQPGAGLADRNLVYNATPPTGYYDVQATDQQLNCDTSGGSITLQMYPGAAYPRKPVTFVKTSTDTNTVTILPFGSETFVGGATLIVLTAANPTATIQRGDA